MLTDFQDMNEEQLRKGVVVELWAIQETHLVKDVKALVIDGYGAVQRNRTTEKRGRRYHGGLLIMYILSIVLTELKSGSYGSVRLNPVPVLTKEISPPNQKNCVRVLWRSHLEGTPMG